MWQFYLSEPRGDNRNDYHAATIVQAIYSIMSSFSKNSKPLKLDQCMLKFTSKDRVSDNKTNIMKIKQLFANKISNIEEYNKKLSSEKQ